MLEFLATNSDGSQKPVVIAIQRAKNMPLISERAKTIMKDAVFQDGRPGICIIKDQMGNVLGEVAHQA